MTLRMRDVCLVWMGCGGRLLQNNTNMGDHADIPPQGANADVQRNINAAQNAVERTADAVRQLSADVISLQRQQEQDRSNAERIREQDQLNAERIREQDRLNAERIREQDRSNAERIREQDRLNAERNREEDRLNAERIREEDRLNAERIREQEREEFQAQIDALQRQLTQLGEDVGSSNLKYRMHMNATELGELPPLIAAQLVLRILLCPPPPACLHFQSFLTSAPCSVPEREVSSLRSRIPNLVAKSG